MSTTMPAVVLNIFGVLHDIWHKGKDDGETEQDSSPCTTYRSEISLVAQYCLIVVLTELCCLEQV